MNRHTPTPWLVGDYGGIYANNEDGCLGPCLMAAEFKDGSPRPNKARNEEFVVHAVNCHYALLTALEEIEKFVDPNSPIHATARIALNWAKSMTAEPQTESVDGSIEDRTKGNWNRP